MIRFACPTCSKSMRVDDRHAGKKGRCPKCGNAVIVPAQSTLIEFDCENCGHTLKVAENHAGKKGRCPACRHPVVVPATRKMPAESAPPQPPAPAEADREEDTTCKAQAGQDRRHIWIIAGAATVAVAVILGLVMLFWQRESSPVTPPIASQDLEAEQSNPVTSDPVTPEPTAAPETTDTAFLTFNPNPHTGETLRVTTRLVMSNLQKDQLQEVTSTQSITVDLEAQASQEEDVTPVRVLISQIGVKTEIQGMVNEYDSADPSSRNSPVAEFYSPFVGRDFIIRVSKLGDIVEAGLDELYLVVANDRVKAEDDMMRTQTPETADTAIEHTDQRFGSRDNRILAMKKQLEAFPLFGLEQIRRLVGDLICLLPSEPVENHMSWDGTITVKAEMNEDVPATYSVTSLDNDTCVIEARGKRSEEEPPFVYQMGQTTITSDLAGSSQVILTVDRRTGWLKSKKQKTLLNGQIQQSQAGQRDAGTATQVMMDIATTVEPVKGVVAD